MKLWKDTLLFVFLALVMYNFNCRSETVEMNSDPNIDFNKILLDPDQNRLDELEEQKDSMSPVQKKFYASYREWKIYCRKPEIEVSSISSTRAQGKAFNKMVDMGNAALPYIFEELKRGDLFLVHAIEKIMGRRIKTAPTSLNEEAELWLEWWEKNKNRYIEDNPSEAN